MLNTVINYSKEKPIHSQPNGTVFASGQELWVKVSESHCMVVGSGNLVGYTTRCSALVVTRLEASL